MIKNKLIKLKQGYYNYLDRKARNIAYNLYHKKKVTKLLLSHICNLYASEKLGTHGFKEYNFEAGYHNPITSDLELFISRILFYYSKNCGLNWKILLRMQGASKEESKSRRKKVITPDIQIVKDNKTFAVIEIKAKAGFMQPFFSAERYKKDMIRLKNGDSDYNPRIKIKEARSQLQKYAQGCNISQNKVFVFIPTCSSFHQKNYSSKIEDYRERFAQNSGLDKDNLIILSKNLRFDPSNPKSSQEFNPSNDFEKFIIKLKNLSR